MYDVFVDYLFKDTIVNGLFDINLNMHLQCLLFPCFGVLQHELHQMKSVWKGHRIPHVRNSNNPGGYPDVFYFTPKGLGVTESHDVKLAKYYCETLSLFR